MQKEGVIAMTETKALFVISYPPEANAHAPYVAIVDDADADPEEVAIKALNKLRNKFARWGRDLEALTRLVRSEKKRVLALRHEIEIRHEYTGPPRTNNGDSIFAMGSKRKNYL